MEQVCDNNLVDFARHTPQFHLRIKMNATEFNLVGSSPARCAEFVIRIRPPTWALPHTQLATKRGNCASSCSRLFACQLRRSSFYALHAGASMLARASSIFG